jgi:alkaline phosphatase
MKSIVQITFLLIILYACSGKDDNIALEPIKNPELQNGKNIILMIGDGMGLTQITGARTVNGGNLNILRCRSIGIQSTHAADKYVTDSGAAATAMACGEKANYYSVGVDTAGNALTSIVEIAEINQLSTGLITSSEITHATPAAFYAHQTDRYQYEAIALELVSKGVDFFLGGGWKYFSQRSDGLNLLDSLVARDYQVKDNLAFVSGNQKTAVLISEGTPLSYLHGRGDILPDAVTVAVSRLSQNKRGFFLMVEGAQIDWAGEENDQDYLITEMLDFDRAVGRALDFAEADGNTLVVITGDHETGGYSLTDGNLSTHTVQGQFLTWLHTGTMVPVFAYGPGEEEFTGVYENTAFFYKFLNFFGLDQ